MAVTVTPQCVTEHFDGTRRWFGHTRLERCEVARYGSGERLRDHRCGARPDTWEVVKAPLVVEVDKLAGLGSVDRRCGAPERLCSIALSPLGLEQEGDPPERLSGLHQAKTTECGAGTRSMPRVLE